MELSVIGLAVKGVGVLCVLFCMVGMFQDIYWLLKKKK